MSVALSLTEMRRFLASEVPEVLCIRGEWGVGKTYAFRKVVADMAIREEIGLKRFAYVSLFGLETLSAVRAAIFDNTIKIENLALGKSATGFDTLVDAESLARRAKGLQALLPGNWGRSGATELLERAANSFVKNQIVCFDDLERSSSGVEIRDVLGLSTHLKEDRLCKIVLILNEEKLDAEDKASFRDQFEKVVDSSIVFDPSIKEVQQIAFAENFEGADYTREVVEKLGLKNIRVISKIIRLIRLIAKESEATPEEIKQIVATVGLAGWVKFEAGGAVSMEDLKAFNGLVMRMRAQRDGADPLPDWIAKPDAIGYAHSDDVDRVIVEAVDRGYIDVTAYRTAKDNQTAQERQNPINDEFSKAWRVYHENLNKTDEEVVNAIYEGMKSNYGGVSLGNFNGTILLFRELGFDELADKALVEYFSSHDFDHRALEHEVQMWGNEKIDPAIVKHFEDLEQGYVDGRDPIEVLTKISETTSWNREDIQLIESLGSEGLVTVLDGIRGDRLTTVLKFLSRFLGGDDTEYGKFRDTIHGAFAEIAARSSNNARKLRSFGYGRTP